MPRRFCIFDFDGTICDSLDAFVSAFNRIGAEYGYPKTSASEIRAVPARAGLAKSGIPLIKLPFLARRVRKELSLEVRSLATFPDMPSVLRQLSKAHTLLIVTSNAKVLVEKFLTANRCRFFGEVHSELDLFGKARRLKQVLRAHKIHPDQAVYIGDETRDVEAARKTEIASVAVSWGFNSRALLETAKPDRIVDSPRDLITCIRRLE